MDGKYNSKRINPPVWQHDYHVLTRLYKNLKIFIQRCKTNNSLTILDYGCGTSPYKNLFNNVVRRYIRVDIDRSLDADFLVSEDEKVPLKENSIDLILSTQVLEHIQHPDFYLSECMRLLKRSGLLLLSTHGLWPYHAYPSDYHRWTKSGLENEIKSQGFKIEKSISILGPFAAVIQFEMLIIAERLMKLNIIGKILLVCLALLGNSLIWLEDKIVPPTDVSDSSLYLLCAKKI